MTIKHLFRVLGQLSIKLLPSFYFLHSSVQNKIHLANPWIRPTWQRDSQCCDCEFFKDCLAAVGQRDNGEIGLIPPW